MLCLFKKYILISRKYVFIFNFKTNYIFRLNKKENGNEALKAQHQIKLTGEERL